MAMPDPYATIASADCSLQERLADILELRASDPQQQAMLRDYLSDIPLSGNGRVSEIGCGTGAVSMALSARLNVDVIGVDPSPAFVTRARQLGSHLPGLAFIQGDGRSLPLRDSSFELTVRGSPADLSRPSDQSGSRCRAFEAMVICKLPNRAICSRSSIRGADILAGRGMLTGEAAEALRKEARRRADAGEFFGHISFMSLIARKLG
jgi:SAM-dependent methyltransferase